MSSKFELLGGKVDAVTIQRLNKELKKIIDDKGKEIIANHNLHSIYLVNNNPALQEFWEKSYLTHIDGMPLIWWGKALGYSLNRKHRVTYLDWIHPLLKIANRNSWNIFYLGGEPGVAQKASKILSETYKDISFATHNGFFNTKSHSDENKSIIKNINSFQPNILMVGMGMPLQERWILQNYESLQANVILNCGACFDYIAEEQKTPPRIFGKMGLEWFYRFINDPKRLFRRYFIEPFYLIPIMCKDFFKS